MRTSNTVQTMRDQDDRRIDALYGFFENGNLPGCPSRVE